MIGKIKNIISQFCQNGKDCDLNGDKLSKNNEKLSYFHKMSKRKFLVVDKNM